VSRSIKEEQVLPIGYVAIVVGMIWGMVVGFEAMKVHPNWWFVGISSAVILVPLLAASVRAEFAARAGVQKGGMPAWLTIFLRVRRVFAAGLILGAVMQAMQTP
jgi:hypothetical protein